jgi:hypothetical protein
MRPYFGFLFVSVSLASAAPALAQCTPGPANFCITVGGVYSINGTPQAPITLVRGTTYTFRMVDVDPFHPFYLTTTAGGGGPGMYSSGVSPTSVSGNMTMTFVVPASAPAQLYYGCAIHFGMGGAITIMDPPGCYANCDGSTVAPVLNVGDFTCFLQRFAAGESYANCDNSTVAPVLNVGDFTCFLQRFAAGCP